MRQYSAHGTDGGKIGRQRKSKAEGEGRRLDAWMVVRRLAKCMAAVRREWQRRRFAYTAVVEKIDAHWATVLRKKEGERKVTSRASTSEAGVRG